MLSLVFGIIVVFFVFLSFLVVFFAPEITEYIEAKTEELKAQTKWLRKEIN